MLSTIPYGDVVRLELAWTLFGRGRYWTFAYRVDDLLVDSGCAHAAPELAASLEERPLRHLVNTHSHEDHIGANRLLQESKPGIEILAHPLALPILEAPAQQQPLQPYRRLLWGYPESSQATALRDGQIIKTKNHRFQVIFTPGHSPDHLCLYEPDRGWLFSGDLFNGSQDRAMRADYHIGDIITSLKRVANLDIDWMFPSCARVRQNPAPLLRRKITYLEEMGQKVFALHQEGMPAAAIARTLFPNPMWIEFFTLGHFSRRSLVEAYLRSMNPVD